jgi:hypothetical protein
MTAHDFAAETVAAGAYTFKVTTKGNSDLVLDAAESTAASGTYTLPAPVLTITGPATVRKGSTGEFSASISNFTTQTVNWTVEGTSAKHADTKFTGNVLSIAAAETNTSLTVTATSTVDTTIYNTATVAVGALVVGAEIAVTITDKGGFLTLTPPGPIVITKTGPGSSVSLTIGGVTGTFAWSVDGGAKTAGATFILNGANYTLGGHSLLLEAEDGGVPWSKAIAFTVTQ